MSPAAATPRSRSLPQHLEALLEQAPNVRIVVDNARLPATSATDEYYQRLMELSAQHALLGRRQLQHASYFRSPIPRRPKLRVGEKAYMSSALPSLQSSLKLRASHLSLFPPMAAMMQDGHNNNSKRRLNRWSNSAAGDSHHNPHHTSNHHHPLLPPESQSPVPSPATRPKMPIRSSSQECVADHSNSTDCDATNSDIDTTPTFPVRRPSWNTNNHNNNSNSNKRGDCLSKLIGDLQLLDHSDNEEEEEEEEEDGTMSLTTASTSSASPLPVQPPSLLLEKSRNTLDQTRNSSHSNNNNKMRGGGYSNKVATAAAVATPAGTRTSALISQVIDNLKLYGDSEDDSSERLTALARSRTVTNQDQVEDNKSGRDDDDEEEEEEDNSDDHDDAEDNLSIVEDDEFFNNPVLNHQHHKDDSHPVYHEDSDEDEYTDSDEDDEHYYEEDSGSFASCESDSIVLLRPESLLSSEHSRCSL